MRDYKNSKVKNEISGARLAVYIVIALIFASSLMYIGV